MCQFFKKWIQQKLPLAFFVLLAIIACCLPDDRVYLLPVLFLLLPFLDKDWQIPVFSKYHNQWTFYSVVSISAGILVLLHPDYSETILLILMFTALPEEWFFRGYFMRRMEMLGYGKWIANGITSMLFATLHIPVQGLYGLSVFVPSLIFGWLYQCNRDLLLVILLHTLFNVIYMIYLRDILNRYFLLV